MRASLRSVAAAALVLSLPALAACGGADGHAALGPTAPSLAAGVLAPPAVRISEIHYDNASTDANEAIEVAGPAGTDLTGWKVILYNGSNGTAYDTKTLSGTIPATCGSEGVVVVNYPVNGIQNGAPDGMALVDATGQVVEFLSYEGTFAATNDLASGMTSTDIGVSENGSGPASESLQRNGFGGWDPSKPSTFGACNDQPPPPYDGPTTIVVSELMGAPLAAQSESWGEWFEVHNYGTEPVRLGGWKLASRGQPEHVVAGDVTVAPGGYAVLGRSDDPTRNGDVLVAYNYFVGTTPTIWLDDDDWLVVRTPTGTTVDSVAWATLPKGATRALRAAALGGAVDHADANGAAWGYGTTTFGSGDFGTPGAANTEIGDVAPAVPTGIVRITFSGRDGSDPALPVGFEDQLFASAFTAGSPNPVPATTTFTWSSATPELASVDQDGVVRALGAGTAVIRAASADGRVALYRVPTRVAVASATAAYLGNTEFGVPTDADASNDFLITRPTYTISYNPQRNTPNWVSYDLEATHFGPEDRCDCFTHDPALPAGFAHLTTADYTGAGAVAGYGIDRGHLVRSSDRTAGSLDNAYTFYLSNIIPQAADLNQGPWNNLEGELNATARAGGSEVYVIAGVAGSRGTVKNEGKITIPERVWKVAVIMPRNGGVADVDGADDFQLIAVDMPNEPGTRNADWRTYRTTVDAIEARSGYDLLAKLPDHIEWLVEAGYTAPAQATAAQLLDVLAGGLADLRATGVLDAGTANALRSKVDEARADLAAGDTADAIGALNALRNQVRALVRVGRLDAAEGQALTTFAGWVAEALGGQ
ncbi:MAG TPA: DNA/RNA non-specific endonuclease [Gemmatimonadales bacterium]|nr:DNA/RNA non-specific endonuclease [Gemmatimonadales bacterium]